MNNKLIHEPQTTPAQSCRAAQQALPALFSTACLFYSKTIEFANCFPGCCNTADALYNAVYDRTPAEYTEKYSLMNKLRSTAERDHRNTTV